MRLEDVLCDWVESDWLERVWRLRVREELELELLEAVERLEPDPLELVETSLAELCELPETALWLERVERLDPLEPVLAVLRVERVLQELTLERLWLDVLTSETLETLDAVTVELELDTEELVLSEAMCAAPGY